MSPRVFSAISLKKHPWPRRDDFDFFSNRILPLFQQDATGQNPVSVELGALLQQRSATLRTSLPSHITTSAVVLDQNSNATLLLFHNKIREWVFPGGHADGDWNLLRSALRECFEETGLQEVEVLPPWIHRQNQDCLMCPHFFQRFEIKASPGFTAHEHFDAVFVFRMTSDQRVTFDPLESQAFRWMSCDEIKLESKRTDRVVDGFDSLTAKICVKAMQSALGPSWQ
jgi:8-oxo-dGTP pyrophosphatase MutT (NUDIX family)